MNRFLVTTIVVSIAIHLATAYFILTHWQIVPVTPERKDTDVVVINPPPPPPPKPEPQDEPKVEPPPRINPKAPVIPPNVPPPTETLPAPPQPPNPNPNSTGPMIAPETRPEAPAVRVNPKYPDAAIQDDVEGAVILIVSVDAEGNVTSVLVEKAEPPGWFESAAVSAVRRWKYKGTGTARQLRVVVAFKLN
jgi:protein TonB